MKKVILIVLLLLTALPVSAAAAEVDMNYTGILDSYTGLPAGQNAVPEDAERVWLNNNTFYDFTTNRFIYELSSGTELSSTVADGMITNGPVSLELSGGSSGRLYRNGTALDTSDYTDLTEPGKYVVSINSNTGVTVEPLCFTIVGSETCMPEEYVLPEGFSFTEVLRDDALIEYSAGQVRLAEEGSYRMSYVCRSTGLLYGLKTKVDRTPPVLELAEVVDGEARGPVTLYDLEPNTSLRIERDGRELNFTQELNESGNYHIWLRDAAGNSTEYQFRIRIYLNVNAIVFVVLILALILLMIIYLVYSRKKLRIR